jgi:hypothetical protein
VHGIMQFATICDRSSYCRSIACTHPDHSACLPHICGNTARSICVLGQSNALIKGIYLQIANLSPKRPLFMGHRLAIIGSNGRLRSTVQTCDADHGGIKRKALSRVAHRDTCQLQACAHEAVDQPTPDTLQWLRC